jgi:hypothetical protein
VLDWTVGGTEIGGKPAAWISAAGPAAPSGGQGAHESLRTVLRYTDADIVDAACARVPVTRRDVGADGLIHDPTLRARIAATVAALAAYARKPE